MSHGFYPHPQALSSMGCVTYGKSLHYSGLSFLICRKEMAIIGAVKTATMSIN